MKNPFRYFNSAPEVIRLMAILYIRYPLWLRQVDDMFVILTLGCGMTLLCSADLPPITGSRC